MKKSLKKLVPVTLLATMLIFSGAVIGASENSSNGNKNSGNLAQAQVENREENQEQNQNQVNNPEEGEMTQNQTRVQEQVREEERIQEKIKESKPKYNPRSEAARQHMSAVAKAVEELVRFSDRSEDRGIGDQVREIARAQGDSEDKVNQALDNAKKRSSFAKFFIGPNYEELKEAKQEMEQNQVRIRELQQIMAQVQNESDRTALQEQITVLEQQNTALQDRLNEEASGFSLFGWLFRLIYNY